MLNKDRGLNTRPNMSAQRNHILLMRSLSVYVEYIIKLTQFCDDRENVYFILLSSSNRKYESLTIV